MVEIMRRPRIIRETARGLETMSLEDDFFQKREIFLTTGIEAEVSTELIKQLGSTSHKMLTVKAFCAMWQKWNKTIKMQLIMFYLVKQRLQP